MTVRFLLKVVLVNVVLIGLILAGAETTLRVIGYEIPDRHYVWPPGLESVFHPDPSIIPGVSKVSSFATNSDGIRAEETPSGTETRKILVIGGSTTEELYLDRPVSWTGRLERRLNEARLDGRPWWVGNLGKSGATSATNVLQAKNILPLLPQMDIVLWFVGANDALYYLRTGYNPISSRDEALRLAFYHYPKRGDAWWTGLALNRVVEEGLTYLTRKRHGVVQTDHGEWLVPLRRQRALAHAEGRVERESVEITDSLAEYRRQVEKMIDLVAKSGARLVLMTQPSLWMGKDSEEKERFMWLGGEGPPHTWNAQSWFFSPEVLDRMLEELNEVLRQICAERGVTCVDMAVHMPKTLRYFYDDVHYTIAGAEVISDAVFEALSKPDKAGAEDMDGGKVQPARSGVPR